MVTGPDTPWCTSGLWICAVCSRLWSGPALHLCHRGSLEIPVRGGAIGGAPPARAHKEHGSHDWVGDWIGL